MNWRFRAVVLLFFFLFLLILTRLFYWQIVRAQELSALGQAQYGHLVTIQPTRGQIMTSDGFAIVANKLSYLVFANPKEVKNISEESQTLSQLLKDDTASVSALLSLNRFWIALKSPIDLETKKKIEALHLSGVGFQEQSQRFYPEASIAAHVLGFVGKDTNGNNKGYFGLEGYYDRQLRGKEGVAVQIHDALGQPILAAMNNAVEANDGRTLQLHIDRVIQFLVDQELQLGIQEFGAESGMAAVMDPKTGGILAMSAYPSFDPRSFKDYPESLYSNPFVTSTYEPGSTFKPLIMASALNAGLVTPETTCPICDGPVAIGGYLIHTWNDKYNANETMTEVIQHSDNTGMVYVAQKLGLDRMLSYVQKFGIGELTGIDLQGEEQPQLRSHWYPIDLATAAFGQGITITPIELLTAFSAIANEAGNVMEPQVVKSVKTSDGQVIPIVPKIMSHPISAQTAKVMTEMLVNAVDNGEAKWTKLKGYRIAGKTGTASIPVAGHYDQTKTIASFIGFGPADDPKFLMLVIMNRPTSSIYGAETAAPVFFRIAQKIMTYYGVTPTE